ncbi:hypothetical protein F5148DRAFT_315986 [Russula earlei]|uniref:Uncharacterized protein n=1 Tax=Russula earlei TaxID=71964 RepID=A0ACC0U2M7_9AGAM|nr:hypothetical protein F5148DRAFT_315986 [Russula earlei]
MITSASPEHTSQHHSVVSPSSATSPMLRARPRLPAGPRTRKQPTFVERQPAPDDSTKDQHHPSIAHVSLSSSEFTPWITPGLDYRPSDPLPSLSHLALTRAADPQTEPSEPSLRPSHPQTSLRLEISDASQLGISLLHTQQPSEDRHGAMPTSVPGTSRPATPSPILTLSPSVTKPALQNPSQAAVSSAISPPLTLPPLQIDFTPEPLPYKHLTLDAAHWTLTSTELQHLVSSAIRQSAKEQFIRLLPPSIIDNRIPEDAAHIERSWDTAASRWRFEAHRRNMLLRALSASGADSDLLAQLTGTLSNLDRHVQSLLHAAAHRTQLAAARDTHRASALAVALRKLNASYSRRTRDLDKARSHIAILRSEVDEAWKVAEEQAAEVDRLKAEAPAVEPHALTVTAPGDSLIEDDNADEDDGSSNVLHDGASMDLTMISNAEVVDVTGKAVAAQARLTMMRTDRIPPSAFSTRSPSSPVTSGSDTPQRQSSAASQVSRVSAARKRSKRKSRASLRLPGPMSGRSRSNVRGESGVRSTRNKSRSKKGKEPAEAEPPLPWIPADVEGSFLEMEGRPAGDEAGDRQVGSDGDCYDDG